MKYEELYEVAAKRRTAKQYNPEMNISEEDIIKLFEFVKTAPHSMGLEFVKIINVRRDSEHKEAITSTFKDFNMEKAFMASDIAIAVSKKKEFFDEANNELRNTAKRMVMLGVQSRGEEWVDGMEEPLVKNILNSDHALNNNNLEEWSARQAYIILGYILIGASALGINSTAVEGFTEELTNYLQENNIINKDERATIVTLLGYSDGMERVFIGKEQLRKPLEDFLKII